MRVVRTHPVENFCPALQSDALKHSQDGQNKVVKVCDPEVRSNPIFLTDFSSALVALEASTTGPRVRGGETVSPVDVASSVHGPHEHLQSDDGVDDDDKEDQQRDLDERDESHYDSIEDNLQAGHSRDQPQWSQHSESSQSFCIKTFQLHCREKYIEKSNHDDGEVKEIPSISQVGLLVLPESLGDDS